MRTCVWSPALATSPGITSQPLLSPTRSITRVKTAQTGALPGSIWQQMLHLGPAGVPGSCPVPAACSASPRGKENQANHSPSVIQLANLLAGQTSLHSFPGLPTSRSQPSESGEHSFSCRFRWLARFICKSPVCVCDLDPPIAPAFDLGT